MYDFDPASFRQQPCVPAQRGTRPPFLMCRRAVIAAVLLTLVPVMQGADAPPAPAPNAAAAAPADAGVEAFQFAEGLFIRQDFESALEEYRGMVKAHPTSIKAGPARYRIGECLMRLEQYKDAAVAYTDALGVAPTAEMAPLGRYQLGRCRLALGEFALAATAFGEAAATGRGDVREESLVQQADAAIKADKLADAVPAYEALLADFPASKHRDDVSFSLAWVLGALGRHAEAAERLQAHLKAYPESAHGVAARLALSDAYVALGRFPDAVALLDGLAKEPAHAEEAGLRLAWARFKSGDKVNAAAAFEKWAEAFPKASQRPSALYNAGIARYDAGDFAGAAPDFARLRTDYPDSPEAADSAFWLGLALAQTGQVKPALEVLTPLLAGERLPTAQRPVAWFTVAANRAIAGDAPGALQAYGTLVADYPEAANRPNALYAMAMLQQTADPAGAIANLRLLVKSYPAHDLKPHALFALGEYLYRQGDLEGAEAALAELDALPPAAGAPAGSTDPKVLYRYGWVRYDRQNFAGAATIFARLAALDSPFRDEARFMTGRAAEANHDLPAAIAAYQAAAAPGGADAFAEQALYRLGFLVDAAAAPANLAAYQTRFPAGEHRAALALRLADLLFEVGKLDDAATQYQAVLDAKPAPPADALRAAAYGLGWCRLKQEALPAAEAAFAAVGDTPPELPLVQDAVLQRAELLYKREQFADAATQFAKLGGSTNSVVAERALYMVGWSARRQDKVADSVAPFTQLLKQFPEGRYRVDAALRLALAHLAAGDAEAARAVLIANPPAAATDPLAEEHAQILADTLVRLQDWKTLLDVGKRLQTDFPESKQAYLADFRLGLAYQALGLLDDAEVQFKATIAATNTVEAAQAQFNIGSLYYTREAWPEAAKQFLRVEMLYDYPALAPKSLYHAIDAFVKGGDEYRKRAETYRKTLHDKYPDSEWTKKADALLGTP